MHDLDLHQRLQHCKTAYATRHVDLSEAANLVTTAKPRPGDLVLAEVAKIGHHKALELRDGRRANLFVGDEIVVAYGHRYAPDQFEAEIRGDLQACDLVAAGGIASSVLSRSAKTAPATRIAPIGLLADRGGRVLNVADATLPPLRARKTARVYAVIGASMNAGKTTTAVSLIRGFLAAGHRVGSAKVTGTGAGGDLWRMMDAGARPALDFTSAGVVSTYKVERAELLRIFLTLASHAMNTGIDILVIEVADGLYQRETALLLQAPEFQELVDGVFFAARDALGAKAGVEWLARHRLKTIALSGIITIAPLAIQEATEAVGLPVLGPDELMDPAALEELTGMEPAQAAL
ncbi:DUF1611 domain-containing protein [Bordetella petrii]|uniref:DUF1611 domain-containing protein n=1 Tax=Bordetella petrii TaxID=94624 RepID=A0ABT7W2R8_9BORD|nr:DUF1611 domain-containing protein [Bordetella petrii]MDM9559447.1 DUF1611 domain-containing protein [Bordetella petrii]